MLPMTRAPNVCLAVENLPENVSLVREVLAGLAGVLPLAHGQLDDIKTVVSEACNNVVIHAYGGARGPLDVEIRVAEETLEIAVRDVGGGLHARSPTAHRTEGIGIPVIRALSDRVEFTDAPGWGTEVRMQFDVPGASDLGPPNPSGVFAPHGDCARGDEPVAGRDGDGRLGATLVVAPLSLAGNVLGRPLTALAARARFSIDRLSDLQLVTDAIAAHAGPSLSGDGLRVRVAFDTRDLELRVGPLRLGMAGQLIDDTAVGGLEPLLATLADEVSVEQIGDADFLTLRMLDSR
jgi:serine/threonine-protein kinase RsbW